jgi:hypothetical protein
MNDDDPNDSLLRALADLPRPASDEQAARTGREARAAFLRESRGEGWPSRGLGRLGPASALGPLAVPLLLAGVVGIYLSWAIGAATALLH